MPDTFLTTNVARLAGSTWCSLFALGLSASAQCELISLAPPEGSAFLGVIDAQPTATNQIELAAAMRTTDGPPSIMLATLELDGTVAAAAGARAPEPFSGSTASEVILQGDLLVGAFPGAANGGAVIVWRRSGSAWTVEEVLRHPTLGARFGSHIALDGDRIVVSDGARRELLVFEATPSGWSPMQVIADVPLGPLKLVGGTLVASSVSGSFPSPRVRIFAESAAGYTLTQVIPVPQGGPSMSNFGRSLAFDGDTLAVGAPSLGGIPGGSPVSVYRRTVLGWVPSQQLTCSVSAPFPAAVVGFGTRLELEQGALIVTSESAFARATRYLPTPSGFQLERTLRGPDGLSPDGVSLVGDTVFLAVAEEPVEAIDLAGSAGSAVVGCPAGVNSSGLRYGLELVGGIFSPITNSAAPISLAASLDFGQGGQVGVFLASTSAASRPVGGGTLCLGGPIVRLRPTSILPPFAGLIPAQALLELDTTTLPFVLGSGASVHFQYWYVDPAGPPGGNFTNSLVVTFCG